MRAVTGTRWLGMLVVLLAAGGGVVLFGRLVGAEVALLRPLSALLPLATTGTALSPLLSLFLGIGAGLLLARHPGRFRRRPRILVFLGCGACLFFMVLAAAFWFAVHDELLILLDDPAGRAGVSALSTLLLPATAAVFAAAAVIAVRVHGATRRTTLEPYVQTVCAWGLPTTGLVLRRVLWRTMPTVAVVMVVEFLLLYAGSSTVQAVYSTPALADSLPLLPAESLPVVLVVALLCILALALTTVPLARTALSPPSSPLPRPEEAVGRDTGRTTDRARTDVPVRASTGFRSADFLDIRDLRLAIGRDETRTALAGIDLTVSRGQALAVVDDDDGASLLCAAIAGLLPADSTILSGSILLDGTELVGLPERHFRRLRGHRVGYLAEPGRHRLNPRVRIGHQLARLAPVRGARSDARARATELLARVGVEDPATVSAAFPHQVSEATVHRVLLAGALIRQPHLLIADDPTGRLHGGDGAAFLDVLHELRREQGFTLIVASAAMDHVPWCDRVAVLRRGAIVEYASAQEILTEPQHPHSRRLLAGAQSGSEPDARAEDA
jgi:ABC-type dipeptide/oligopeptide/nickel transport system ATPase component/ABC-type dipeptide/oligopeptide/nickel transport system permease component